MKRLVGLATVFMKIVRGSGAANSLHAVGLIRRSSPAGANPHSSANCRAVNKTCFIKSR